MRGQKNENDTVVKKSLMIAGFNKDYKECLRIFFGRYFDVTVIEESLTAELPDIYAEKMPDNLILLGELKNYFGEYVGQIFSDIKLIKVPEQKVLVAGTLESIDINYRRLPMTNKKLLEELDR